MAGGRPPHSGPLFFSAAWYVFVPVSRGEPSDVRSPDKVDVEDTLTAKHDRPGRQRCLPLSLVFFFSPVTIRFDCTCFFFFPALCDADIFDADIRDAEMFDADLCDADVCHAIAILYVYVMFLRSDGSSFGTKWRSICRRT